MLTLTVAAAASHATQTVLVDAVPSPFTARPDPTPQVLWTTQGLRSFTLEYVGGEHAVQVMSVVAEPDGSTNSRSEGGMSETEMNGENFARQHSEPHCHSVSSGVPVLYGVTRCYTVLHGVKVSQQ
jgi:hypothetical protein